MMVHKCGIVPFPMSTTAHYRKCIQSCGAYVGGMAGGGMVRNAAIPKSFPNSVGSKAI